MFLDRLPTRINLVNKNLDIPSILCPICQLEAEQIGHLFLRCEVAARTWNAIFSWINVVPSNFDTIFEMFIFIDNARHECEEKKKG